MVIQGFLNMARIFLMNICSLLFLQLFCSALCYYLFIFLHLAFWLIFFFMPPPAEGRSGAYSVLMLRVFVSTCLCHVSLGGHNIDTFYARKSKFDMLLTQT